MGRLGSFFSNVGTGIKNFGLRVGSTFNKIAPKALHYGRLITGGLSKLPGVIGTAAGIVHRGMSYADNIINSLSDSNLKDKLKSLEKNGTEFINKAERKANDIGNSAVKISQTADRVINAVSKPPPIL